MTSSMIRAACMALFGVAVISSACAASPQELRFTESPPEAKLFGDYLSGKYADNIEDAQARSKFFSAAFARDPKNAQLGSEAIRSAVLAGDMTLARTLSIEMTSLDATEPMARIVLSAYNMRRGKYDTASERLAQQPEDPALGVLMAMMEAWAQYGQGNSTRALEIFNEIEVGGYFDVIAALQKAIIYGETGQTEQAERAFKTVSGTGVSPILRIMSEARYKSQNGDMQGATAVLEDFSGRRGGVESGPIYSALTRLNSGKPLTKKFSAADHAGRSLIDPAGAYFSEGGAHNLAEFYLRIALIMSPDEDFGKIWLGNVLEREERVTEAEALYQQIKDSSDFSVTARLARATLLFRDKQDDRAVGLLKKLVDDHPIFLVREALGRGYLIKEDYASALTQYTALVAEMNEAELTANPEPLYFKAICLQELGRWDEAVADLRRILALKPDYADALNFLGYSWVERGENLDEAFGMIRTAVKLEPESGAIIDSLGWAHYKLGQYDEAMIHLEDATAKDPTSATITDHLGDVYWKLGRKREAGYQWRRALDLDPTEKEIARINVKLKSGLDAAAGMP
ncbi:tetratricopeptide repeat protein [Robiginitomaculum antarcticum]|uniref:tetratricopeptide repeat protein n=1 Tax=Robiginitomaculum antarcticum TaxID=437507 RepID=UPI0014613255|nr:tetratricopeptide repeat protein [Robiginitomaculum antarcticum]